MYIYIYIYKTLTNRSLETVSSTMLVHFHELAVRIVEERGAVDALAAALALISGNGDLKPRSLLTSREV